MPLSNCRSRVPMPPAAPVIKTVCMISLALISMSSNAV
jgi:hypothetical protein